MLESTNQISKIESWLLASRPKTLPAAVMPVFVGTSIAIHDGLFNPIAAIVALLCSLLIQIGTNFVNDLHDYLKGSDKKDRLGPIRVLVSGLISENEMRIGIAVVFSTAFILGMYLVYLAGWFIFIIGVLSLIAGYAYTAGPYPLAYNGLGDIFVFIFFGFVGTIGTYYVQAQEITMLVFWSSIPVGALITNILVVNNYRDLEEDKIAGKNTLAVKFGGTFAKMQYLIFMILSYSILFLVYFTYKQSIYVFLPLLTLPIAIKLVSMIFKLSGKDLNSTLALTAKLSAVYGILFAVGILL
ncbi:MAG: 1,4-dihydroxy-2-naphthoate polyprenyltransferase [Melioribacteraceae bacterium]|nr:MAG: 1,4-dihydroxy-2-naphthoate polyprenyltransferase [Melioribacteraceae bacterium]